MERENRVGKWSEKIKRKWRRVREIRNRKLIEKSRVRNKSAK